MVASCSPHRRHHGDTPALFSHPTTTAPTSPPRHLLRNPSLSSCSPFALTLPPPPSVTTRSASRRSSPTKPRSGETTPTKFPLSVSSSSSMNTAGLHPESCSPYSSSRDHKSGRPTFCPDATSNRPLTATTSPLKRSDRMMDADETSRGSPVAKRRSAHAGFYSSLRSSKAPVFNSPASSNISRSPSKRSATITKKSSGHTFEKPSFVRSRLQARQQLDFSSSVDTTSRVRRVTSVENLLAPISRDSPFATRNGPLPSASAHPHVRPLSRTAAFGAARESKQLSSGALEDWTTPQNYKSAKPNIMAFHSTGFVPKRGRPLDTDKDHGPQPDTPCKRTTAFPGSTFQSKHIGSRIPMGDLGSPHTPVPLGVHSGLLLNRRDSILSNDSYDQDDSTQSSGDYELPPTPTKKSRNAFDDGSVFTVSNTSKRSRTESDFIAGAPKPRATANFGSPKTPKDNVVPPDPSNLSISGKSYKHNPLRGSEPPMPVTPARDGPNFKASSPLFPQGAITEDGISLYSKFAEVKHIGTGQFSEVYRVTEKAERSHGLFTPGRSSESGFSSSPGEREPAIPQVYAVKKAKNRFLGPRDRRERMAEVQILRELANHEHVVSYVDHWTDEGGHLCIQTEFCENGSLDRFLEQHGTKGRLDEFRVWKMLLELCLGLQFIHEMGFMHLDIKPGNIFIVFSGALKIGDFGMAMKCPPEYDIEKEGDRAYIAQEVLDRRPGQPGDIFSLGVCMIEIAGNEALPPYGLEWESLRKGDISVAPTLSTSSSGEFVHRDEDGNPILTEVLEGCCVRDKLAGARRSNQQISANGVATPNGGRPRRGSMLHKPKPHHLVEPPDFMENNGLEKIVQRMIAEDPDARPTATELLKTKELHWIDSRRRSTATIFEGLWGPSDLVIGSGTGRQKLSRSQRLIEEDFSMNI